jgi:hypothetical protein
VGRVGSAAGVGGRRAGRVGTGCRNAGAGTARPRLCAACTCIRTGARLACRLRANERGSVSRNPRIPKGEEELRAGAAAGRLSRRRLGGGVAGAIPEGEIGAGAIPEGETGAEGLVEALDDPRVEEGRVSVCANLPATSWALADNVSASRHSICQCSRRSILHTSRMLKRRSLRPPACAMTICHVPPSTRCRFLLLQRAASF